MAGLIVGRIEGMPQRGASALVMARVLVAAGIAVFIGFWIATALVRWRDFEVAAFDFAFFDQVVWNTSEGRIFETTLGPYNYAGQHFQPVLLPFAAAYRLGASPLVLLEAQAVVCGLAAMVLFEAGRALRLPLAVSVAAALAYLANPHLHRALIFDFHPETMIALPAFAAVWAFAAGRPRVGLACGLSVLLFKEDAVFVAIALSVCAAGLGAWRYGAVLAAVAAAWAIVVILVYMPSVREGVPSDLIPRYQTVLGDRTGGDGLLWMVTHPIEVLRALASPGRARTLGAFVLGGGPWLLAAPLQALTLIPSLALSLLSSHQPQHQLQMHYAVEMVPVAVIAGLFGARRLLRLLPAGVLAASMCLVALVALWSLGPAPVFAEGRGAPTEAHREAVALAVALIPPHDSVSAQSSVAPRLAHRETLWEFPARWSEADWVVVDRYGSRSSQSIGAGFDSALTVVRERYALVFDMDGVSVYRAEPR